jgi:hypothetical protein
MTALIKTGKRVVARVRGIWKAITTPRARLKEVDIAKVIEFYVRSAR